MRRLREWGKNFILLLLVLLMPVLSVRLWLMDSVGVADENSSVLVRTLLNGLGLSDMVRESAALQKGEVSLTAARILAPQSVAVVLDDETYACVGDSERLARAVELMARYFDSAVPGERIDVTIPAEKLPEGDGMLLDLGRELPLKLVLRAFGAEDTSADVLFRVAYLTEKDETMVFCFLTDAGWQSISLQTEQEGLPALEDLLAGDLFVRAPRGGDATVMYDAEVLSDVSLPEWMLPWGELPGTVEVSNPLLGENGEFSAATLSSIVKTLSYNPGTLHRSTGEDGSQLYVEDQSHLTVYKDGRLDYKATTTVKGLPLSSYIVIDEGETYSFHDAVAAAHALVDSFDPSVCGGERGILRYSGSRMKADGALEICFAYMVDGLRVESDTPAAVITYREGYFTEVRLRFAAYASAEPVETGMPVTLLLRLMAYDRGAFTVEMLEPYYRDEGAGATALLSPQLNLKLAE